MTSLDWRNFTLGDFAVHCQTNEDAKAFIKECIVRGLTWRGGMPLDLNKTCWINYRNRTLYYCASIRGMLIGTKESFSNISSIDYTASSSTVVEVERKAVIGEYIRVCESSFTLNKYEVDGVYKALGVDEEGNVRISEDTGVGQWVVDKYVVLEGCTQDVNNTDSERTPLSEYSLFELVEELYNRQKRGDTAVSKY